MQRRLKLFIIAFLFFLCGAYSFIWFESADRLEKTVLGEIEKVHTQDKFVVRYDQLHVTGFPFSLKLVLSDPFISLVGSDVQVRVDGDLECTATIFSLNKINVQTTGPVQIALNDWGGGEKITVQKIQGFMHLNNHQNWQVVLQNLKGLALNLNELRVSMTPSAKNAALRGQIQIHHLGFDNELPLIKGVPSLVEEFTVGFDFKPFNVKDSIQETLKTWYESEGVVDFDNLKIYWGPIKLDANGTVAVDENLQPLVSFATEIQGVDEFMAILVQNKVIHKNLTPVIKVALGFLKEKKIDAKGGDVLYHKVPISLQDRELTVASIPLAKFPPINWNKIGVS